MRSIAVAGGTGAVGKTIVDALVARDSFIVTVLSRRVCEQSINWLHTFLTTIYRPNHLQETFTF
jgi:NAD dependent epimerase/dehydratase family enzyme